MAKQNNFDMLSKLDLVQAKLQSEHKGQSLSGVSQSARTNFSPVQANMSRYMTYGSKIYGQLGFDPTRDNNALYNQKTTGFDDVARGYEGMWKLAKIGFQDTFALGVAKDKNSSFDFEQVMNDYSSTRGGGTQLFSNTLLSSGYTAGILGAIAAEEILLTAGTALTGGVGGVAQGAETAALGLRAGEALKTASKIGDLLDDIRKTSEIKNARGFFGKIGDFVNPISNTSDFVKTLKNGEKMNDLVKVVNGAGALVRDMRTIYMTHSESKLEAEMSKREFFNSQYEEKMKNNEGGVLDSQAMADLKNKSDHVYNNVYTGNLGLIYATNKITFDNMFKTMKGTNKYFNIAENGLYKTVADKTTGKLVVEAIEKPVRGFKKYLVDKVKPFSNWKTGLSATAKTALTSSMEGVQELGQDMLAESTKSYISRHNDVEQLKGGLLDQTFSALRGLTDSDFLSEDLAEAGKGMISAKGLETFLSGALMGAFASPVGVATQGVNSFLFEGGRQNLKARIMDSKGYKEAKTRDFKTRQDKAKVLTEFFNDTKTFVDFVNLPLIQQQEFQSDMIESARDNNTFDFKNAQARSFAEKMYSAMDAGLHEELKDSFRNMADSFSVDELKQVFAREDITPENENEFRNKLRDKVSEVDSYKKRFDAIQTNFKNPVNLGTLSKEDPEFMDKYFTWKAYDTLKKEALVYGGLMEDSAKRLGEMKNELSEITSKQGYESVRFFDKSLVASELDVLKKTIESHKGLDLNSEEKARLDGLKDKYEKLNAYQKAFDEYDSASKSRKRGTIKLEQKLYSAFKDLVSNESVNEDSLKSTFDKLLDYVQLGHKNDFQTRQLEMISGIESRESYVQAKKKMYEIIDSNKESIIGNALKNYELKKASDDMLNALYDQGLFFNTKELDDLIKDGQMPSQIFNIATGKVATKDEYLKAQDILRNYKANLKNLELLERNPNDTNKTGKRSSQDSRTVEDLLDYFEISMNSVLDLADAEGIDFLNRVAESEFAFTADETLIKTFTKGNFGPAKIKFVKDQDQAITYDSETKTYLLDLRYAGSEYNVSKGTSFESLTARLVTQIMIAKSMDESSLGLISKTMNEVKELMKDVLPVDSLEVFTDPEMFVSEVLNNPSFQNLLSGLSLSEAITDENVWDDMIEGVQEYLGSNFESKALKKVLTLIKNSFDGAIEDTQELASEELESTSKIEVFKSDAIEDIMAKYNVVNNEFQTMLAELKSGKLKPKELRKLKRELVQKAFEVNRLIDLIQERNDTLQKSIYEESGSKVLPQASKEVLLDSYGNQLIPFTATWSELPTDLKSELVNEMFPEITTQTIKKDQVIVLLEELQMNPVLQQIVTNYNNALTEAYEKNQNKQAAQINKQAIAERILKEKSQNQLIAGRKKLMRTTLENNIRKKLGEDFELLTDSEIKSLIDQFSEKKSGFAKFTMDDVLNFVKAKKLKMKLDEDRKMIIRNGNISKNTQNFKPGNYSILKPNNRRVKVKVTPQLIEYFKRFNSEMFALPEDEFKIALEKALANYAVQSDLDIKGLKAMKSLSSPLGLYGAFLKKDGLYPNVVRTINAVYRKFGEPYVIKRELKNSGEFYKIETLPVSPKAKFVKTKTPKQKALNTLRNYINEYGVEGDELGLVARVVDGFQTGAISVELLKKITQGHVDYKSRMSFTKSKLNIVINSRDGFSDFAIQDSLAANNGFIKDENSAILQNYIDEVVRSYKSPLDALYAVARKINEKLESEQNKLDEANYPSGFAGNQVDEDYSDITDDEINYYASPEGIEYLEKQRNEQLAYYDSLEFKIQNGLFVGNFSDLSSTQKELYALAVSQGFYGNNTKSDVQQELGNVRNELDQAIQENNVEQIQELSDQVQLLESSVTEALDAIEQSNVSRENDSPVSEEMIKIVLQLPATPEMKFKMLNSIIKDSSTSLTKMIAVARVYSQDKSLSKAEIEKLDKAIKKAFKNPDYYNQTTVVDNQIFWFNGIKNGIVLLVDSRYQRIEKDFDQFVKGFEKTPIDGEKIGGVNIDAVVNVQEIAYIKSTINELFDTFGNEQETFRQKDIIQNLAEHFKTCK